MFEHDEDDRYIAKSFVEPNRYKVNIEFVTNVVDFWEYLSKAESIPCIILLNYHIAPLTAVELVKQLKNHHLYAHIPVLVLSGTVNSSIIRDCYLAGASSFIQKPATEAGTADKVSTFLHYWFETVSLS